MLIHAVPGTLICEKYIARTVCALHICCYTRTRDYKCHWAILPEIYQICKHDVQCDPKLHIISTHCLNLLILAECNLVHAYYSFFNFNNRSL